MIHRDLHHGQRRLLQRVRRLLDPAVIDVPDAAHAHILPEEAHKIALAESAQVRQLRHTDLLAAVLRDILQDCFDLLPAAGRGPALLRFPRIAGREQQRHDLQEFRFQQKFIERRPGQKSVQRKQEHLPDPVISLLPAPDHLRHLQLPLRQRTQIPGSGQILPLRPQKVQMEHQTVRDHRPARDLAGRVRTERRDQQDIPLPGKKIPLPDPVIRASLPDQRDLHLLVPVERQLPVCPRHKTMVAVHRHQNIAVPRFFPLRRPLLISPHTTFLSQVPGFCLPTILSRTHFRPSHASKQ